MLAIIGSVLGFLASGLPELFKYLKANLDYKRELEIMKLQIDFAKVEHQYRLEEITAQADIAESQALYQSMEQKLTGVRWIDAFNAFYLSLVRPTITFTFVAFYGLVKYAQYMLLVKAGKELWASVWQLWTPEDGAILATIICFWFGQRAWRYSMGKIGTYAPSNPMTPSNIISKLNRTP